MLNRRRMNGFTLFELIVTISVAAIIVSFAVPGFTSLIRNNQAVTHTNDLVTALNLARSEATRRGADIFVCSSEDGATCADSANWSTGWIVRTADDTVLRAWAKRSGGDDVMIAKDNDNSPFRFLARGSLGDGPEAILVRLPDCTGDQRRDVTVNAVGRISVARGSC